MKISIKKLETKAVKNIQSIKGGADKKSQWFEEDEDWQAQYDEIVNQPK